MAARRGPWWKEPWRAGICASMRLAIPARSTAKTSTSFPIPIAKADIERGQNALQHLLHALPWPARRRQRHGGAARLPPAAVLLQRPPDERAGGTFLRRHHQRLWRHAELRLARRYRTTAGASSPISRALQLSESAKRHRRARRSAPESAGGAAAAQAGGISDVNAPTNVPAARPRRQEQINDAERYPPPADGHASSAMRCSSALSRWPSALIGAVHRRRPISGSPICSPTFSGSGSGSRMPGHLFPAQRRGRKLGRRHSPLRGIRRHRPCRWFRRCSSDPVLSRSARCTSGPSPKLPAHEHFAAGHKAAYLNPPLVHRRERVIYFADLVLLRLPHSEDGQRA